MVGLAQLVRASDCGSEGHGFEPHIPPQRRLANGKSLFLSPSLDCSVPKLYGKNLVGERFMVLWKKVGMINKKINISATIPLW